MLPLYRNTFSSIVCNINVQTCVAEISRRLSLAHKRIQAALAAMAVALIVFAPIAEAAPKKKIGVLCWSQESRYTLANKGFVEQLAKEGFGDVEYVVENAMGNKAKAMTAAERFSAMKLDMVVALGTTAAVAAANSVKNTPVIINNVYDPVDAKIAESWKSSGNNVTGSSPKYHMSKLVATLKQFTQIKKMKLAVLYTPGEKNSETQLRELRELSSDDLKIEPVPLTRAEDVSAMMPEVLRTCDAVYLSGSSIAGASAGLISNMATRAKVVTITHSEDLIPKGVLLGVCADPVTVGALAGKKAAKVLNGASPASVPIEAPKKLEVVINMRPIKAEGIKVPMAFFKSVTKTIE